MTCRPRITQLSPDKYFPGVFTTKVSGNLLFLMAGTLDYRHKGQIV